MSGSFLLGFRFGLVLTRYPDGQTIERFNLHSSRLRPMLSDDFRQPAVKGGVRSRALAYNSRIPPEVRTQNGNSGLQPGHLPSTATLLHTGIHRCNPEREPLLYGCCETDRSQNLQK